MIGTRSIRSTTSTSWRRAAGTSGCSISPARRLHLLGQVDHGNELPNDCPGQPWTCVREAFVESVMVIDDQLYTATNHGARVHRLSDLSTTLHSIALPP